MSQPLALRAAMLGLALIGLLGAADRAPAASRSADPKIVVRPMDPTPGVHVQRSRRARPSVVGGTVISVQQAPWAIRLLLYDANHNWKGSCSGSIIGPTEVVTAEHCFRDKATGAISIDAADIVAGASRFDPATGAPVAQPGDVPQVVKAASRRWIEGFVRATGERFNYDMTVLTLSKPLNLAGPTARTITVVEPGAPLPYGTPGRFGGFGIQDGYRKTQDGFLRTLGLAVADPRRGCESFTAGVADGTTFCASPPATGNVCFGDSGSGLATGSPPILLGVLSGVDGQEAGVPGACPPGGGTYWTNLTSRLHRLIDGREPPPPPPPPPLPPRPVRRPIPAPRPAPVRRRPSLELTGVGARVTRGTLTLRVGATGGSGPVFGTVAIELRRRRVGGASVRVASGSTATVRVRLNARGRRALRRKRVRLDVRLWAAGGLTTRDAIVVRRRRR